MQVWGHNLLPSFTPRLGTRGAGHWVGAQAVEQWVVPSHKFVGQCAVLTGIHSERKGKGNVPGG